MLRARGQAEQYAKALPEWPPFLIVVDVGHSIETYADFTGAGKHYAQFPDANSFRIFLPDLAREEIRDRLRTIWLDPLSLDPSRHAARATREIAARLALLGRSLEKAGHGAERVALFLMRALFTMFAEDVGLLPRDSFRALLRSLRGKPHTFAPMLRSLWATMDKGGFSPALGEDVLRFNGGLFQSTEAIALDDEQLELLIDAAEADWSAVEPAIFGTLLERASTRASAPGSAPITRRAPMSSALCCRPSSSRCAPIGRRSRPPPSNWPMPATNRAPSPSCAASTKASAGSRSSTRPAAPAISSTSRSST